MKKISGLYTNHIIYNFYCQAFVLIYLYLLLLKKLILSNTGWTFLFSENKAHFRFFRETQDVKVIFPRDTGSKFRETQDIIELLYKDK